MNNPTIVASENGRKGIMAAIEPLRNGCSALDAVEIACRVIEDDPEDMSVGYGGLPNLIGDVELDASIMDGRDLSSGAVASVSGYGSVITLARQVMQELPHVLLVGKGAERFAREMGHPLRYQHTPETMARWRERLEAHNVAPDDVIFDLGQDLRTVASTVTTPVDLRDKQTAEAASKHNGKEDTLGTVNFLVIDQNGDMASGVTTSGLAWKYPGRVGDSPIIGAGNYCDNRYGAAACTGMGELAIRVSTARSLILYMKMGMSLHDAGLETLRDLSGLGEAPEGRYMNIVSLKPNGEHAGFTTIPGKSYLHMTANMDEAELLERTPLV